MSKRRRSNLKRIRTLIFICFISAVVFSVSTYAWFVGMQRVGVTSFDIGIATTESLELSLDGSVWSDNVSISENEINTYTNHTNRWSELKPISTVGEMDKNSSRMIIFEKSSMTTTPGGYRLLASRIDNYTETEAEGYVVFDLFIKNITGDQYYPNLDIRNEEAIYLTTDSKVEVNDTKGVPDTGIENSVRVAFAQIGRAKIGTSTATITGITCISDNDITGICSEERGAIIWEPNDKGHNQNAINWYDVSCKKRTAKPLVEASYGEKKSCEIVEEGKYSKTYAIKKEIEPDDEVDVYDGEDYNSFVHDWEEGEELLYPYPYFTDTMKELSGTKRPTFMTLAPNSVTKVRIYIYLEGQDVDNYDLASIGKMITVNFGFTKQRYEKEDIDYEEPNIPGD